MVAPRYQSCPYCSLFKAPDVLPDKYFREEFCWRLRAPGSSFEAADTRECLQRTKARLDEAQALLEASSDRYLQTIHGLEAQVQTAETEIRRINTKWGTYYKYQGDAKLMDEYVAMKVELDALKERLAPVEEPPGYMSCPQVGSGGAHEGSPCKWCGFRYSDD